MNVEPQAGELAVRITELEHAHLAAQEQLEQIKFALDRRQALVVELGNLLTEQRAYLLDLESKAARAIEEAQQKAERAEAEWFAVYAELERVRERTSESRNQTQYTERLSDVQGVTALVESRMQAARLSAEVSILRVRAVKAERRVSQLDKKLAELGRHARHLE